VVEAQLFGVLIAPVAAGTTQQVTARIALASATILQHIDVLARSAAEVAADQAADGPAHGSVGATKVEKMLFGLIGAHQHDALLGERIHASQLEMEEALQGMDAAPSQTPFLGAVPGKVRLQRLGGPPTLGKAELGEYGAGGGETEILHQVLPQQPHGHGIDEQRTVPRKADHAVFGDEFQQFLMVEIICPHSFVSSFGLMERIPHFDRTVSFF